MVSGKEMKILGMIEREGYMVLFFHIFYNATHIA